ncbi:DUF4382 domain-containing protein [Winogradskyella sp. F6397]|uniref:DUF4382 domain-containing protein n=1 Tax=Winogradskyella marina TaxID=2785530 RepID=A0ABS0EP76_9FLAO|nr:MULTISPECIES: DUF4382 domain-containing protein [Winogradskyella]MBF8151260.1 DUF4382 domain-containing protein [Winogradskyella marina]
MKHLHILKIVTFACIVLLCTTSCSKEELNNDEHLAGVSVSLKSATKNLNPVFLDIEAIEVRVKEDVDVPSAWVSLDLMDAGIHNVSGLNNDSELLLVDHFEIKPVHIFEIRLVLGDNNFMDINEVLVSLDIKEKGNATPSNLVTSELERNHLYDISINLDIDESIWFDDNESMMILNPKIYTEIRQFEY